MACPFLKKTETTFCIAYPDRPLVVDEVYKTKYCESKDYIFCPTLKERK